MSKLFDTKDAATKYKVQPGETLDDIAGKHSGAPHYIVDWKDLALFNWGTTDHREVCRALFESVGWQEVDAYGIDHPDAPFHHHRPQDIALEKHENTKGEILIPKPKVFDDLPQLKTHTVKVKRRLPAVAVGIGFLDKWFIPGEEECALTYRVEGSTTAADKVDVEVYGSHYCECADYKDGFASYTELPDADVYHKRGITAEQRSYQQFRHEEGKGWRGQSNAERGILAQKHAADDRHINVAFSPYTVAQRYYRDATPHADDKKARIVLAPFWPKFQPDGKPETESLAIRWGIKGTTRMKRGSLIVRDGKDRVVYAAPLSEKLLEKSKLEAAKDYDEPGNYHAIRWDGKYNYPPGTTETVAEQHMPYRVQVHAHTDVDEPDGLALCAAHTEVRMFVHPKTILASESRYRPEEDQDSLVLAVGDVYNKDTPPAPGEGVLWYKYQLAKNGYHPGPVIDATPNADYRVGLREFRRSVPKGAAPSYARLNIAGGDSDGDTQTVLQSLDARWKRHWFGTADGDEDIAVDHADFADAFATSRGELAVWVDDREFYTNSPWLPGLVNMSIAASDEATVQRGHMSLGDGRANTDSSHIPRPWLPIVAQPALLGRLDSLALAVAEPLGKTDQARKAIGPLRIDWSFDEIDAAPDAADFAVRQIDDARYDRDRVRTKKAVEHILEQLGVGCTREYDRRRVRYRNCPDSHGGERPSSLASYHEKVFGWQTGEQLEPWIGKSERGAIATVVHDHLGQPEAKRMARVFGKSGIYFRPSRIGGDGYQLRAQVSFRKSDDYTFPNAETLSARYPRRPQAHTARLRVWRRSSVRAHLAWCSANHWGAAFRDYYAACNVRIADEPGVGDVDRPIASLLRQAGDAADHVQVVQDAVAHTVTNAARSNAANIAVDDHTIWPWAGASQLGVVETPPVNASAADAYTEMTRVMSDTWYSLAALLGHLLVKKLERRHGRLRGHFVVEFATPAWILAPYQCNNATCGATSWFCQRTDGEVQRRRCPACGTGKLRQALKWKGHYLCSNGHAQLYDETGPAGGRYGTGGYRCTNAGCGGTLSAVQANREDYGCPTCNWTGPRMVSPAGGDFVGQPCPACARPLQQVRVGYREQYRCDGCAALETGPYEASGAGGGFVRPHAGCARGGTFQRQTPPQVRRCNLVTSGPRVDAVTANTQRYETMPLSSLGLPLGVAMNYDSKAELWAHEVGHTRFFEHASSATAHGDPAVDLRTKQEQHDAVDNTLPANNWATLGETNAARQRWDRACIMSYANLPQAHEHYDATKDRRFFCGPCVLKNRGWKLGGSTGTAALLPRLGSTDH